MLKSEAIQLLGGAKAAIELIGMTPQALSQWPDELTPKLRDRVQAALWRKSQGLVSAMEADAKEAA